MAFIDAGFDGTVDEVQFANMLNRYAVVGPDDFKASNVAGADRTLSIADGTALGPGTLNVGTGFSPIQFDAVTSGTVRWDLVVLRRDWQPPGGNTSIAIIKGGSLQALPGRNTDPGVIDDQPLYLQQVIAGSTSLGTRVDLRLWVGAGGAEAADLLALTYLASPGAAVKIGGVTHRYELQGNGVWGWREYLLSRVSSSTSVTFNPGWENVNNALPLRVESNGTQCVLQGLVRRVEGTGEWVGTIPVGLRPKNDVTKTETAENTGNTVGPAFRWYLTASTGRLVANRLGGGPSFNQSSTWVPVSMPWLL